MRSSPDRDPRLPQVVLWIVLLFGAAARLVAVDRPMSHVTPSTWHEADYVQIARAFAHEDLDPLRPRVDWRGTSSGEVEMELPVLPWLASLGYRMAGDHEGLLRLLAAACSIAALFVFSRLARRMLDPPAALFACAAFAFHPLALALASSMQPEPLQLLLVCTAGLAIESWWRAGGAARLFLAGGCIGAAILAKSPAAYLGLLLAYLVLRRHGPRALFDPRILGAAAVALLPPLAWYAWAHSLYARTGLSLGLSNETHFLSLVMLRHPVAWVKGLARIELREVFGHAAILLAACALLAPRARLELPLAWYAAVLVFYVVTADTAGDEWAFYYHVNSVAPVCLLLGAGFSALRERRASWAKPAAMLLSMAALAGLCARAVRLHSNLQPDAHFAEFEQACREFTPLVPPDALLVVRGGNKLDEHGHPVAYNESLAFAWMDRKGWNYPIEDFGLDELQRLARAGAQYWIAQPADLADPGLRAQVESSFARVATSGGCVLFRIGSR